MKLCCIFNYNPLYRFPIFEAMSKEFDCDFYFGVDEQCGIEKFDPSLLSTFKGYIYPSKIFGPFTEYSGLSGIFDKKYTHYIITGEPFSLSNWKIILYSLFKKKKVFFWTHGTYGRISKPWTRLYSRLFYHSAELLLYGKYSSKYLEDIGCSAKKIHIIHNSLNTSLQTSLYEAGLESEIYRNHFGNDNPTLIYIGRIQIRKKLNQLMEAVYRLQQRGKVVNVVVVGPETDDYSIKEQVEQLGLTGNVWFYGPSYDEKTNAKLLYNAACCVSPGNVGLTCIHSLSYGTPVITNNNFDNQMPEFEAVQPGITGDFFKENDIDDLARVIAEWIDFSKSKREMVRDAARKIIMDEWSVEYQINILKNVLR